MNFVNWLAVPMLVFALAVTACGDDGQVDTSKLEDSFSSVKSTSKGAADDIVSALQSEDYAKAGAALKRLAGQANLTSEQKEAIGEHMCRYALPAQVASEHQRHQHDVCRDRWELVTSSQQKDD